MKNITYSPLATDSIPSPRSTEMLLLYTPDGGFKGLWHVAFVGLQQRAARCWIREDRGKGDE